MPLAREAFLTAGDKVRVTPDSRPGGLGRGHRRYCAGRGDRRHGRDPRQEDGMYKVMWLLKRKRGITLDQFRDHYENSHSVLGNKYLGHLLIHYKRNYKTEVWGGDVPTAESGGGGAFGPREWE